MSVYVMTRLSPSQSHEPKWISRPFCEKSDNEEKRFQRDEGSCWMDG